MLMTVPPVHLVMAGPCAVPVLPDVSLKQLSIPQIMVIIPPPKKTKKKVDNSSPNIPLTPMVWWHVRLR